jgi:hypothetical protein
MQLFYINILIFKIFFLPSTCFEPEVTSSARRLYIQLCYGIVCCTCIMVYHTCIYNHLPEDEPSGSKHVEGINKLKIKIIIYKTFILFVCIL